MATVRLSGQVRRFLDRETLYLIDRSPTAATAFLRRLDEAISNLSRFPEVGRKKDAVPVRSAMRLIVGNYVLDYTYGGDVVTIVTIRHGRQLDPGIPNDDNSD